MTGGATTLAMAGWQPALPLVVIIVIAIVALLAPVAAYSKRAPVTGARRALLLLVRGGVVLALTVLLLGPVTTGPSDRDGSAATPLIIAVDTSASMSHADATGRPRFDIARDAVASLRSAAGERPLQLRRFDDVVAPIDSLDKVEPDGDTTRLFDSLSTITDRARPGGGLLIVSDGRDTSSDRRSAEGRRAELIARAQSRGVVVHALVVGGEGAQTNRGVRAFAEPAIVFDGEPVRLRATVSLPASPSPATVTLSREGDVIETMQLAGDTDATVRDIDFFDRPTGGADDYRYDVFVSPMDGEQRLDDNTATIIVPRAGGRLRVLVMDGSPHWETRALIGALRHDSRITMTTWQAYNDARSAVTQHGPEDADAPVLTSPVTADTLAHFDAVVLGRQVDRLLGGDGAGALIDYVSDGGGLMLARGRPFSEGQPLQSIVPAQWGRRVVEDLRLRLTDQGGANVLPDGVDLRRLPAMRAAVTHGPMRGAAVVLLDHDRGDERSAAVAYQRVGQGRVMTVYSTGLWRWSMLPPRLADQRAVYGELVRSLVATTAFGQSPAPTEGVAIEMADRSPRLGRATEIAVVGRFASAGRLLDQRIAVSVADPLGGAQRVALSIDPGRADRLVGTFTPTTPGQHTATLSSPQVTPSVATARFNARPQRTETTDLSADASTLAALAAATGGAVLTPDTVADALRQSPQVDSPNGAALTQPAWVTPWVFAAIVVLAAIEWFARRTGGLA